MSELDDKLKDIHISANSMMLPTGETLPTWYELTDDEIAQIKQLFREHGWDDNDA